MRYEKLAMTKTKDALKAETITCLADTGFYDGQDIAACAGQGVTCMAAKPRPGGEKRGKNVRNGTTGIFLGRRTRMRWTWWMSGRVPARGCTGNGRKKNGK